MPDLEALVADQVATWEAGNVTVAARAGAGEVLVVGDGDRRYDLASVTKLFTAVATLVAVEEGAVALDDPAGPPGATVEHLLAHASGLAFEGDEAIAPPGQRRIYSNTGFEVLAATVAEATEIDFDRYAHEAVVEPLGLAGTEITGSPAAGWRATAPDVLTLLDQVRAPTLLAAETVGRATTTTFPGLAGVLPGWGRYDPLDWGLGFEVRDGKSPHWTGEGASPRTVGHFGGAGTFAWHDPEVGVSCVALGDRPFDEWAKAAWPRLADLVRGGLTNGA